MPRMLVWIGFCSGLFLVLGTSFSLFRTLVVPRDLNSRLGRAVERGVRRMNLAVGHRLAQALGGGDLRRTYEIKDRVLSFTGPGALLTLLAVWQISLITGYALLLWPFVQGGFPEALRESGSSFFTLGFDNTGSGLPTVIDFFAAAAGLITVALLIAYLPTLYSAFNRRETLVTTLESRAGAPAWGPEILARHHMVGLTDALPAFYADWERWAADVGEGHTNYPILLRFRSPNPYRSWIVGLLAVLDSAAILLAFNPSSPSSQARLCLRMGFTALRDIGRALRLEVNEDPRPDDPIEMTYEEFLHGVQRLEAVNFPMERSPEEAWPHFRGWRVNYESLAYAVADRVDATPGPWSGVRSYFPHQIEPRRPVDRRPDDPDGSARRTGVPTGGRQRVGTPDTTSP